LSGTVQGDRILNCSGEHRQQVVFIKTTEKSFLPQANLASTFLPQKIESNMPHRSYIFGGLVLPDTTAIFIERDISWPMELILDIPMLADHRDEGGGRPHQTGNV